MKKILTTLFVLALPIILFIAPVTGSFQKILAGSIGYFLLIIIKCNAELGCLAIFSGLALIILYILEVVIFGIISMIPIFFKLDKKLRT
jgi:hypothetical protein